MVKIFLSTNCNWENDHDAPSIEASWRNTFADNFTSEAQHKKKAQSFINAINKLILALVRRIYIDFLCKNSVYF